jgi:hypothetical protein
VLINDYVTHLVVDIYIYFNSFQLVFSDVIGKNNLNRNYKINSAVEIVFNIAFIKTILLEY